MIRNQKGFVLFDCLISLVIISVVLCSFFTVFPQLLAAKQDLYLDQEVKNNLYAIKNQLLDGSKSPFDSLTLTHPVAQTIINRNGTLCVSYMRRDLSEKTYCLP